MSKIFLLTLEYPPQHGGVAKYLEGEVKASSVPVVVSHVQGKSWLPLIWQARRLFATPPPTPPQRGGEFPCDYLWISHVLPMGYIALVWKWIYKTPYRVYLHGLDLVLPRKSKWKTFWVKIILKNADEIIVNSHATAELLDYYKINSRRDAKPCVSVRYPRIEKIDTEQYKPIAEKLREQYKINNKPILLTISRLVKRKGIDLVIKSLPRVWQQIPDLVCVVVGEGEERVNLERLKTHVIPSLSRDPMDNRRDPSTSLRSAQDDAVIFTGSVSEEEKYGWLSACNCFILTPIDDPNDFEGYGIVYKEAQMFGKPVIGSRVGGVPEAIGDDGVLVEPGNIEQIAKAIINTSLSQRERAGVRGE